MPQINSLWKIRLPGLVCTSKTVNQRYGYHVLKIAMIAVGWIIQRTFFVYDTDTGFMGPYRDFFDVINRFTGFSQLLMQCHVCFHRCLRVKLSRERNLEQDVFHHIRYIFALEFEWPAFE